jgi:hypothetical protein
MAILSLIKETPKLNYSSPLRGSFKECLVLRAAIRRRYISETISALRRFGARKELETLETVGMVDPESPEVLEALNAIHELPRLARALRQVNSEPIFQ